MDLLRHLRFFVTVAEVRHFGYAADDLGMTQPPLSQGVQRLERRLGVRLFERNSRGVSLTDAGAQLLPFARRALDGAESFTRAATEAARQVKPVVLGLPVGVGGLLAKVSTVVRTVAPVPVVPVVAGSVELVERVAAGELDLAVVRHPLVVDGTRPGAVLTLPSHLVAVQPPPSLAVDLPFAGPPRDHHPPAHDQFVDSLRRAGHSGATIPAASADAVAALVSAGAALAVTADEEPPAPLRRFPLPAGLVPIRVRVVRHPLRRRADIDLDAVAARLEAT